MVNISDTGLFYRGDFFVFLELYFNTLSYASSDFTVMEDAGIEFRTVETLALAVRRYNHSAAYHPQYIFNLRSSALSALHV